VGLGVQEWWTQSRSPCGPIVPKQSASGSHPLIAHHGRRVRWIMLGAVAVALTAAAAALARPAGAAPRPAGVRAAASTVARPGAGRAKASPVRHIVVLYLENHSFDSMLGYWCDAHPRRCPKGGMP
jgi:phospholipase C